MRDAPLLNLVLGLVLAIAVGWLLYIGRSIILPILTAVIVVYVIVTASEALRKLPGMDRLPLIVLRFAVLLVFTLIFSAMAIVVTTTVREIAAVAPVYEANLERLLDTLALEFHLDAQLVIAEARAVTIDQIDLRRSVLAILGGFTSVGASVFLVIFYSAFLLAERGGFPAKIRAAFKNETHADQVSDIISDMNQKIGKYLATKTLINVVLGVISFVILEVMQVDFALFWAIVIALFNYIPYVGSSVGVALPVLLSIAQFGSVSTTLILLALLTGAQIFVGNYLEPKLIGKQLNLSPFVVIVALVFWSALWGVSGAILAIPMTSVVTIVLSTFPETRFLAVMLAHQIDEEPATT